jgi:hypothetical protein
MALEKLPTLAQPTYCVFLQFPHKKQLAKTNNKIE